MKKANVAVCLSVAALMGTLLTPTLSLAASKSQNMPVQAQVGANCNFTSTPSLTFPSYDPIGANATLPLDGSIVVNVRCTQGATVQIGIDAGTHATGTSRAMQLGATTNRLVYDLYQDSLRTVPWTNSAPGWYTFTSLTNAPTLVPVYGRVPGGQDVPAGTYDDIVVVTVNY